MLSPGAPEEAWSYGSAGSTGVHLDDSSLGNLDRCGSRHHARSLARDRRGSALNARGQAYPGVTALQRYPSEETEIVRIPVRAMMTPPEVSIPPDQ